jgi:2-haloacid dehalogenase
MQDNRLTASEQRPTLVIFDVNETLSDLSGLAATFAEVGERPETAAAWFAGLLRDGFALTVTGSNPAFAELAEQSLQGVLAAEGVADVEGAVATVIAAFGQLPLHGDVVDGVRALAATGLRLVTLTNGATSTARGLFQRNGIEDCFERLLSVADAPAWKPARSAYEYALKECGVSAADALLVAVHPWDLHGAAAAGLSTAFVNRTGARYPEYFTRPDLEVGAIGELAAVLAGGGPR